MYMDFVLLLAIVAGISAVLIVCQMAVERRRAKRQREEDERAIRHQDELAKRYAAQREALRAIPTSAGKGFSFANDSDGVSRTKPVEPFGASGSRSTAPTAKAAVAQTRSQSINASPSNSTIDDWYEMRRAQEAAKYTPQSDAIADGLLLQAIMSTDYSRPSPVERSAPEPSRECSTSDSSSHSSHSSSSDSSSSYSSSDSGSSSCDSGSSSSDSSSW